MKKTQEGSRRYSEESSDSWQHCGGSTPSQSQEGWGMKFSKQAPKGERVL